ncbi:MAG: hypothetical protein PF448_02830, partial [Bacteroidales bacterium]|nr:hypothetical protein [Bacteroidales bacterium]
MQNIRAFGGIFEAPAFKYRDKRMLYQKNQPECSCLSFSFFQFYDYFSPVIVTSTTYWKNSFESRYAYKKGTGTIQPSLFTALSFVNIGFYSSENGARL